MKTKILFLASHLSTGGMPQFLLKRIETLKDNYEIFVVENECVSDKYVIQRDKIIKLVGEKNFFTTIGKDLIKVIQENQIDIVHLEHEAEGFDYELMNLLYDDNRKYRIVETCHNVFFNPKNKVYYPDGFAFCTPYHHETFKHIDRVKELIMYPIEKHNIYKVTKKAKALQLGFREKKVNVLSVGLWCDNKNQKKILELAEKHKKFDFHIVGNQAENFMDYWKPLMENIPKNVKVWGEREDISDFMLASDVFLFPSKVECNPIVLREAISFQLPIYANNLPQYCGIYDSVINPIDDLEFCEKIIQKNNYPASDFFKDHNEFYNEIMNKKIHNQPEKKDIIINKHFVDGAFLEITGNSQDKFKVEFFDGDNLVYENTINCNSWVKLNRKYYTDYKIKVSQIKKLKVYDFKNVIETKVILDEQLSLKGKRVMISFESSSLGDTLAWMPYCDEFQKKHDCVLFVSTFKNFLFEGQYPNITFIEPAKVVTNLYAKYDLGWFYDSNKEPVLPNTIPLQQTATNILGLSFSEINPKLNFEPKNVVASIEEKYVCIAPDSTAGCKEWDLWNWQKLVYYLIDNGYKVVNVSINTKYNLENVYCPENLSLEATMQIIHYSEFFVGLSSGLSWLAWSLNKHVYMIANFTKADHEFQSNCTRLTNEKVCNGCWNNKNFKFDKGDWDWCPINKGYEKQFECQKSIEVHDMVIKIGINKKNRVHD
jgi:autotransporter strand-loop-strand O-heptosyltransferase